MSRSFLKLQHFIYVNLFEVGTPSKLAERHNSACYHVYTFINYGFLDSYHFSFVYLETTMILFFFSQNWLDIFSKKERETKGSDNFRVKREC